MSNVSVENSSTSGPAKRGTSGGRIAVSDWGKDHWSILGYLMSRAADNKVPTPIGLSGTGVFSLEREHLRCNEAKHPMLRGYRPSGIGGWRDEYSTRLRGYWKEDGSTDLSRWVTGHDDWDVLDDLEADGIVEIISLANGYARLTKKGLSLGARLVKHKAGGGHFATFDPSKDARGRKARGSASEAP